MPPKRAPPRDINKPLDPSILALLEQARRDRERQPPMVDADLEMMAPRPSLLPATVQQVDDTFAQLAATEMQARVVPTHQELTVKRRLSHGRPFRMQATEPAQGPMRDKPRRHQPEEDARQAARAKRKADQQQVAMVMTKRTRYSMTGDYYNNLACCFLSEDKNKKYVEDIWAAHTNSELLSTRDKYSLCMAQLRAATDATKCCQVGNMHCCQDCWLRHHGLKVCSVLCL